jgi:hypothetical protein
MGGTASLTVAHMGAIGNDFTGASGSYILAAPTGGDAASYLNGIWWLDAMGEERSPSLVLPTLPEGWVYEGWVVGDEGPISTGRFTSASGQDSDGAGPAAGPNEFPPFPGQDFVNPPTDLTGYMATITIEPEPDNSPMPFTLAPLTDEIEDVGMMTPQEMSLNTGSFPTGTATFATDDMMQDDGAMDDEAMGEDESTASDAVEESTGDTMGDAPEVMPETGAALAGTQPLIILAAGLLILSTAIVIRRRLA